jgi:hypothetical protein
MKTLAKWSPLAIPVGFIGLVFLAHEYSWWLIVLIPFFITGVVLFEAKYNPLTFGDLREEVRIKQNYDYLGYNALDGTNYYRDKQTGKVIEM